MEEMQQSFLNSDPDATLVAPRFDEAEAQTAQPVVPLARASVWQPRRLPVALVLVSALLGGLVSVAAYRLFLRPARTQEAVQAGASAEAPKTAATPAPQEASTPPLLTASVPTKEETARAEVPASVESKPEERAPVVETRAAKDEDKKIEDKAVRAEADARQRDERASRESAARRDSPRAVREEPPRARRVEVIPAYPDGDRIGHDRRRDHDDAGDYQPDRRDGRRWGHRIKGRNIDRIRDIFGAPPPG